MSAFECLICLGDFTDPCSLPCGHSFCRSCITKWLSSNASCAHCRLPFNQTQLATNYQLVHVMDELSRPKVIPSSDLTELVPFTSTNVAEISFCKYRGQPAVLKQYRKCVNGVPLNGEKISVRQYSVVKALEFPQNLVRIFGITKDPHGIVMEQLSNSLQHLLHQKIIFTNHDADVITKDIVSALTSLHYVNFVHRDISAGNVFIKMSSSGVVLGAKLGDLDQVKQSNSSISMNFLGTAAYVAPEVMEALDTRNDKAVDVFSLGVLLYALYTSTDPSSICSEPLALMSLRVRNGCKALIDLSKIEDRNIASLLTKMTSINPSERPTIEQVYSFFFNEPPSAPIIPPVISPDCIGINDSQSVVTNESLVVADVKLKSDLLLEPSSHFHSSNVHSTSISSRLVRFFTCNYFSRHQTTLVGEGQSRINGSNQETSFQQMIHQLSLRHDAGETDVNNSLFKILSNGRSRRRVAALSYSDPACNYLLGLAYLFGVAFTQNVNTALSYFSKSADKSFAPGIRLKALLLVCSRNDDDKKLGRSLLEELHKDRYEPAAIALAASLFVDGDAQTALSVIKGYTSPAALALLGEFHLNDKDHVVMNHSLAFDYFVASANSGYVHGITGLAICHYYGFGVCLNHKNAQRLLNKALKNSKLHDASLIHLYLAKLKMGILGLTCFSGFDLSYGSSKPHLLSVNVNESITHLLNAGSKAVNLIEILIEDQDIMTDNEHALFQRIKDPLATRWSLGACPRKDSINFSFSRLDVSHVHSINVI
ncbi:hypothetical protein RCL1_002840 [Eukaryota sp. TZLM3-RCL]